MTPIRCRVLACWPCPGARDPKTEAERLAFGGLAGVAYDPCYHQARALPPDPKGFFRVGIECLAILVMA